MGLSGKAPAPPQLAAPVAAPEIHTPSIGELSGQAANANISNLPAIIDAFNKYGPEAAAQMLTVAKQINPTLAPLGDLLGKRISEVSSGGIPATLKAAYERNFRESMAARGFADSPASANAEAIGLATEGETYAQNTIADATAYAGILPKTPTIGDLGLTPPTQGELVTAGVQGTKLKQDYAVASTDIANQNNINQYQAAQDAYNLEQSKRKAQGAQIGALVGELGGNALVPGMGTAVTKQMGASIGGTFF